MEFKDIAAVTGRPGLFQILKPTRSGVILESIDSLKQKMIINSNSKVSILKDISIYTTTSENNVPLEKVMQNVHKLFAGKLDISSKSSDTELRAFMKKAIPDYDSERVYLSDIKKLATWYGVLSANCPEVFSEIEPEADKKAKEPKAEEAKVDAPKAEKPKAAAKTKTADAKEEKPKAASKAKTSK
ncbi:MAG: hypothetical protein EAZ53_03600 [Bacteroidetes bacterium]|nr:MAG: hypothetical protein EAZ53_03600 [Bacteroidota bacterium]